MPAFREPTTPRLALLAAWALASTLAGCGRAETASPALGLPDLSGLAWVEGDRFLAVHDAKATDEPTLPRVSLLTAPRASIPLRWTALDVDWSLAGGPSHDLESVARVPGTATYLLAESGDSGSAFQRLFVADLAGASLTVREVAPWPFPVFDVEGTAVARVGSALYFLFAERAHGERSTRLIWARLGLAPFTLRDRRETVIESPWPTGPGARPVSALEVDSEGRVYVASAYDPDRDEGPFRSAVWMVGRLVPTAEGAAFIPAAAPEHVATLDGLKVESLTVRADTNGTALYVGTDDESFGGVLRRLP